MCFEILNNCGAIMCFEIFNSCGAQELLYCFNYGHPFGLLIGFH